MYTNAYSTHRKTDMPVAGTEGRLRWGKWPVAHPTGWTYGWPCSDFIILNISEGACPHNLPAVAHLTSLPLRNKSRGWPCKWPSSQSRLKMLAVGTYNHHFNTNSNSPTVSLQMYWVNSPTSQLTSRSHWLASRLSWLVCNFVGK